MEAYSAPKNMAYGSYSYHAYGLFRTKMALRLLQQKMTLWLIEADAAWLQDPRAVVLATPGDIVTADDLTRNHKDKVISTGFILLRPTEATVDAWNKLNKRFGTVMQKAKDGLKMGNSGNEQMMFGSMIREKTINVNVSWLDPQLFVNGKDYERINTPRVKLPMVVQNNWIIGNVAKIARAKKWKHWYLDDNGRCL